MTPGARSLVAALALALAGTAVAQPAAKAPPQGEAEQFFRAAEQLYDDAQYDEAAKLFEKAYAVLPLPAICFSTAQAYRLQYFNDTDPRKLKRAIELYEKYVQDVPRGGRKADASQSLRELRPLLAAYEAQHREIEAMPAAPVVTKIMVTTQVHGARASIDGGPGSELPLVREIAPGTYRVRITAKGYFPFDETRDVALGQFRVIEEKLVARPARVAIHAPAGAHIEVDGRAAGSAPLAAPLAVAAGSHLVSVTLGGHQPWSRELSLKRGQEVALDSSLATTRQRRLSYWVFGAAAASLVASGASFALAAVAGSDASSLERKRVDHGLTSDELARYEDLVGRHDERVTASWILLGVGGGLAATGALLYVLDNPRVDERAPTSTDRALSIEPTVSAAAAGLAVGGRF